MLNKVKFKNQVVPEYITNGNSARFAKPFFDEVCKGDNGIEIGYGKNEWRLNQNALCYDITDNSQYKNDIEYLKQFEKNSFDWIFSSHCLEHIKDYKKSLMTWTKYLKKEGVLFLYLPHYACLYWRVNLMPTKRHLHDFNEFCLEIELQNLGYKNIEVSDCDLAYSFGIYGEKS